MRRSAEHARPTPTVADRRERRAGTGAGFSLMEVVLVAAILAVMTAVALPRYAGAHARYRAEMAARRIMADLELARNRALAASASQPVVFSVDGDEYTLPGVADLRHPASDYHVIISDPPYRAELVAVDAGGDECIIFNGFGVPDSGLKVVLRVRNITKIVMVGQHTGEVRIY